MVTYRDLYEFGYVLHHVVANKMNNLIAILIALGGNINKQDEEGVHIRKKLRHNKQFSSTRGFSQSLVIRTLHSLKLFFKVIFLPPLLLFFPFLFS
jgi:hypothetical protein